jgi:hypothetical protein
MRVFIVCLLFATLAVSACKPPTLTDVCRRKAEVACQRINDCEKKLYSSAMSACVDAGVQALRCDRYELLDCSVEASAVDYLGCLDAEAQRACQDDTRPAACAQLREQLPDARHCPLKVPVTCKAEAPISDGYTCMVRLLDCTDGELRVVTCTMDGCSCNVGSGVAGEVVRFPFEGCPTKETYTQRCSEHVIIE